MIKLGSYATSRMFLDAFEAQSCSYSTKKRCCWNVAKRKMNRFERDLARCAPLGENKSSLFVFPAGGRGGGRRIAIIPRNFPNVINSQGRDCLNAPDCYNSLLSEAQCVLYKYIHFAQVPESVAPLRAN